MKHLQTSFRSPRHALTRLSLAAAALASFCAGAQAADQTYI